MNAAQLEAVRARHGAATPGPWRWADWSCILGNKENPFRRDHLTVDLTGAGHEPRVLGKEELVGVLVMKADYCGPDRDEDGAFLAHSWQDTRDLLAEVDRLRGVVTAVNELIEGEGDDHEVAIKIGRVVRGALKE